MPKKILIKAQECHKHITRQRQPIKPIIRRQMIGRVQMKSQAIANQAKPTIKPENY